MGNLTQGTEANRNVYAWVFVILEKARAAKLIAGPKLWLWTARRNLHALMSNGTSRPTVIVRHRRYTFDSDL